MIGLLAEDATSTLMADLPAKQRDAVVAHVVEDRGYPELAGELHVSEDTVRQRVSRGLASVRRRMGTRRPPDRRSWARSSPAASARGRGM
jgi:RNA polymerase sigma-70 factor (ECF subfamily)